MSIFASHQTLVVHPPSDPSASVTLQALSGRAVELAQAKHAEGAYDGFNGRGWANKFLQKIMLGVATEAEVQAVAADPLAGYDRFTVVRHGIQSWSYTGPDKKTPLPIDTKTVGDIKDDPLEFFALEIMRLTKPQLFQTAEEQEAAQKKG